MFRVPLIGCRKTRHQPHQPLIGSEMPVDMVAKVRLTGLTFVPSQARLSLGVGLGAGLCRLRKSAKTTRPGVIRTHDQGITRTRVVLVIESAKTGVFAVSPVKASGLVLWDEVRFCPVTVPYSSNSVGFGRTPKLSSRSPPGLRQVVSGDKFSIRREGPACWAARARQRRLSISLEPDVQMPGQQASRR